MCWMHLTDCFFGGRGARAQLHQLHHAKCAVKLTAIPGWNRCLYCNLSAVSPSHQAHGIVTPVNTPCMHDD